MQLRAPETHSRPSWFSPLVRTSVPIDQAQPNTQTCQNESHYSPGKQYSFFAKHYCCDYERSQFYNEYNADDPTAFPDVVETRNRQIYHPEFNTHMRIGYQKNS